MNFAYFRRSHMLGMGIGFIFTQLGPQLSAQTLYGYRTDPMALIADAGDQLPYAVPGNIELPVFSKDPSVTAEGLVTGVDAGTLLANGASGEAWAPRNKSWNFYFYLGFIPLDIALTIPFGQEKNAYWFFQLGNPLNGLVCRLGERWLLNEKAYIGVSASAESLSGFSDIFLHFRKPSMPVPNVCFEGRYKRVCVHVQFPIVAAPLDTQLANLLLNLRCRLSCTLFEGRSELIWSGGEILKEIWLMNQEGPEANVAAGWALVRIGLIPTLHARLSRRCRLELGWWHLALKVSSKPSSTLLGKPLASFNAVPMVPYF